LTRWYNIAKIQTVRLTLKNSGGSGYTGWILRIINDELMPGHSPDGSEGNGRELMGTWLRE
jgi:hypothetical protein